MSSEFQSKNRNIRDVCSVVNEFNKGYEGRRNLVENDDKGDRLADSHSLLTRRKSRFSANECAYVGLTMCGIWTHGAEPLVLERSALGVEMDIELAMEWTGNRLIMSVLLIRHISKRNDSSCVL
jgi:hypothetical protein